MDSLISACVNKILSSFRLLEYSVVDSQFDKIEEALDGNPLDQSYSNKISALVLPIFYPGDNSNFRLKFNIQCMSCSHLLKISPDLRFDIIVSIMDIFQQYPHIFIGQSSIKNVLHNFFLCVEDNWTIFNNAAKGRTNDFIWSFFMYCFDNIECSRNNPNWDLILRLISDKNLYRLRNISDILSFLENVYHCWGSNPILSSTLTELSLNFNLSGDDIPPFLYSSNAPAISIEEKTLKVISIHLSDSLPLTARSLSLISRHDGQFASPLYQISLFLSILQTAPINFKNTLTQRLKSFIKRIEFTEKVAAHIVAAASLCQISNFSVIETFSEAFSSNEQKYSLFFAYLADCSQSLDLNSTIPLINDAFDSVESSGPAFGICKFISSLLDKCRLHPEILGISDIENMKHYIDVFFNIVNKKCSEANNISDVDKMVKLTSKIIAKLGLLCNHPLLLSLDSQNTCQVYLSCAVCAALVSYSSDLTLPLDYMCIAYATCIFFDFQDLSNKIKSHVCRLLNSVTFPPTDFKFNENSASTFLSISQKAFRLKICPTDVFYKIIIMFLPCIKQSYLIGRFIRNFWNEKVYLDVPTESISMLLKIHDNYDDFFKIFVLLLKNRTNSFFDEIQSFLTNNHFFRTWFISKFLFYCAFFFPQAYKIARKIYLTPAEFNNFLPALRKVIPKTQSQTAVRAAAIKFVGSYQHLCPSLSKYCILFALSSLMLKKDFPDFPTDQEMSFFSSEADINSSSYMMILNNELRAYTICDNKNASSLELNALLNLLTKAIENNSKYVTDFDLDSIHQTLKKSNDPRIRKSYLKFLSSLGLKGIPYACQISPNVPVTPFF